jgi:MFS family permease
LGIGTGISVSLLGKNLTFYSPAKKGIINGLFFFGLLIVTAIFVLSGEKIIAFDAHTIENDEEFYPEKIAERIKIYLIIGEFSVAIGLILGLIFLFEYKAEENGEIKETIEQESSENLIKPDDTKRKIKQVLLSLRFWRITSIIFLINFAVAFMINTGRTFGSLIGIDGTALQYANTFQTLVIVLTGPILGIVVDKKGPVLIMLLASITSIITALLFLFFMDISFIFITAFVLTVLGVTQINISFGPFIMEVYGIQESVILGGIMSGIAKIGDIITTVAAFLVSLPNDEEKDNPQLKKENLKKAYKILYLISAIFCGISTILIFFESKEKFIYETNSKEDVVNEETNGVISIAEEITKGE